MYHDILVFYHSQETQPYKAIDHLSKIPETEWMTRDFEASGLPPLHISRAAVLVASVGLAICGLLIAW